MLALFKNQHHGEKSVLGKELRSSNYNNNEPDRIEAEGNEFLHRAIAQVADGQRHSQPGKPHAQSAGESGEQKSNSGPRKLVPCVLKDCIQYLLSASSRTLFALFALWHVPS